MATKTREPDFVPTVEELKAALSNVVDVLAEEYKQLNSTETPITPDVKKLLGIDGIKHEFNNHDLTRWRISYWESVQDRLWSWYKHGKAPESRP